MEFDKINKWISVLANIGVLAGIVFLALEINQNTASLRSTAYQNRTEALFDQYNMITSSDELMTGLAKMEWNTNFLNPDPSLVSSLTPEENIAVTAYFRVNWFRFDNLYFQYLEGALDTDYFQSTVVQALPGYIPWFEIFNVPMARDRAQEILDSNVPN